MIVGIQVYRDISVDFSNSRYIIMNAKQHDSKSRFIRMTCTNVGQKVNLNPNDYSAFIRYRKSDGYGVFNKCIISTTGQVIFELTEQMLSTVGTSYADLVILDVNKSDINSDLTIISEDGRIIENNGSLASTMSFYINVMEKPLADYDIESTNEFSALNELLLKASTDYEYVIQISQGYANDALNSQNNAQTYAQSAATSEINAAISENNALLYKNYAKEYYDNIEEYAQQITSDTNRAEGYADAAATSASNASTSANNASTFATNSETYANLSKSYAIGEGNSRQGETTDNSKFYALQAQTYAQSAATSEINAANSLSDAQSYIENKYDEAVDEVNDLISNAQSNLQNSIDSAEQTLTNNIRTCDDILSDVQTLATQVSTNAQSAQTSATNAATSESNASTSATNAATSENNAQTSATNAKASEDTAKDYLDTVEGYVNDAETSASNAAISESNAEQSYQNVLAYDIQSANNAKKAQSYAVGGTDFRQNEDCDNAAYYYDQILRIITGLNSGLMPMGTITFNQLENQTKVAGYMYNISDDFTSTNTFKDGGNIPYRAGTNVYYTADGYWDCLSSSLILGIKGAAETLYRKGYVNITPEDIGVYAISETYSKTEIDDLFSNIQDDIIASMQNTIDNLQEEISNLVTRLTELEKINNVTLMSITD